MVKNEQNGEDKDHAEDLPINVTVIDEKKQQSTTQKSLAIAAVKDKRVFHVPEAGSFVVKGSNGDNYSVSLFPEKCQCPSVGSCYHIMAVKVSIGEENIEENRIYNLTQLRRNNRKRVKKKAGTKKPRPCDEDVTVIAAPDSCMKRNGKWSEDILPSHTLSRQFVKNQMDQIQLQQPKENEMTATPKPGNALNLRMKMKFIKSQVMLT